MTDARLGQPAFGQREIAAQRQPSFLAAPGISAPQAVPLNLRRKGARRMVIASHLVFTAYGFWLPNDPRGSWSDFVRCWELYWYGPATKVTTRRSLAQDAHNQELRLVQKTALRYDPVRFSAEQIACVARGFARAVSETGYALLACSIMPEHVHTVALRHRNPGERIIGHLKTRATQQLIDEGLHPFLAKRNGARDLPPAWARRGWKVFLDSDEDVARAIQYVEENPLKQGMARQRWEFVTPV
jgi:REP element-mobilizing transposase RayT